MAHAFTCRRSLTSNVSGHRFADVALNVFGSGFFIRAADLTHHNDGFGFGIRLKHLQALDKIQTFNRVAAYAHASTLA